jgi:hypothetical protein
VLTRGRTKSLHPSLSRSINDPAVTFRPVEP